MLENIVVSFAITLLIGFPLSIYAGFISARILGAQELRNRATVLVAQIGYASTKRESLQLSLERAEEVRLAGLAILEAGHRSAGRTIESIGLDLAATLKEKLEWRESVQPANINSTVFTPVFSESDITEMERKIRETRFERSVILSLNFRK